MRHKRTPTPHRSAPAHHAKRVAGAHSHAPNVNAVAPDHNRGPVLAFSALALVMLIALSLALLRVARRLHRESMGSAA